MIRPATTPSQARPALRHKVTGSLTALAAVAAVGLIAAACGSTTPKATGNSNATTTTAGSPAATTGSGAAGQVVANATSNAKIGSPILVTTSGMTLYTLSADTASTSACTGGCVSAWPPLTVASGATPKGGPGTGGTFGTITRADGTVQVTFDGHPLYTFAGDSSAGATSGQGIASFGGTWAVATAGGAATSSKPTTPKSSTTTKASSGGYGY